MNDTPVSAPRSRAPLILGFLLAGGALLGLGLCTRRVQQLPTAAAAAPPIELLAPRAGDTVRGELVLRFRTSAPLALSGHGWMAGDLHPHAILDGRELMAGAGDISARADTFSWRLPLPGLGEHTLLLGWASRSHAMAADTAHQTVRFFFSP